jgi:hypothetical protein
MLKEMYSQEGIHCDTCTDAAALMEMIRQKEYSLLLTDEEFAKLKAYIDKLEEGEQSTKKNGTIYVDTVAKREEGCVFKHTSTHSDCDYTFFMATAVVDYQKKEVSFKSSMC